jgi:uncharacterized protein (DUF3084 family)
MDQPGALGSQGSRVMFGLSKPALIAIAAGLLIAATAAGIWFIYYKGEQAGGSAVIDKVQADTIKKIDNARTEKEKTNDAVRRAPIDDLIDGLR